MTWRSGWSSSQSKTAGPTEWQQTTFSVIPWYRLLQRDSTDHLKLDKSLLRGTRIRSDKPLCIHNVYINIDVYIRDYHFNWGWIGIQYGKWSVDSYELWFIIDRHGRWSSMKAPIYHRSLYQTVLNPFVLERGDYRNSASRVGRDGNLWEKTHSGYAASQWSLRLTSSVPSCKSPPGDPQRSYTLHEGSHPPVYS